MRETLLTQGEKQERRRKQDARQKTHEIEIDTRSITEKHKARSPRQFLQSPLPLHATHSLPTNTNSYNSGRTKHPTWRAMTGARHLSSSAIYDKKTPEERQTLCTTSSPPPLRETQATTA